jgi:hypothetical protein
MKAQFIIDREDDVQGILTVRLSEAGANALNKLMAAIESNIGETTDTYMNRLIDLNFILLKIMIAGMKENTDFSIYDKEYLQLINGVDFIHTLKDVFQNAIID